VRILQGVRAASVSLGEISCVTPSYLVSIQQTWRKRAGEGGRGIERRGERGRRERGGAEREKREYGMERTG